MDNIEQEITKLEKLLLLPKGFYKKLLNEDDWSFIIKISALFEAASTQALTCKLNYPELERSLSYLEQANPRSGKIIMMKQLDVINDEQVKFMIKLAELRNNIVHNISEVKFSFDDYFKNKDSNQKKAIAKVFGHGIKNNFKIKGVSFNRTDCTIENTKFSIWVTAHEILACIHADINVHSKVLKFKNELWQALTDSLNK